MGHNEQRGLLSLMAHNFAMSDKHGDAIDTCWQSDACEQLLKQHDNTKKCVHHEDKEKQQKHQKLKQQQMQNELALPSGIQHVHHAITMPSSFTEQWRPWRFCAPPQNECVLVISVGIPCATMNNPF